MRSISLSATARAIRPTGPFGVTCPGDAAYKAGQFKQYDPAAWTQTADNQCGASGWYGEQTLDIEAVHAVAPAANIRYVGAASCQDSDLIDAQ